MDDIERLRACGEEERAMARRQLVVRPGHRPRTGWDERFRQMAERGDDRLLDAQTTSLTRWDAEEWEWF